ncbi:MAG: pantoate--beta-alanine ligase [Bacteroidales bacterium]|nr:pantoate--beta-alanine ligase [Bacteroidales bacterium]
MKQFSTVKSLQEALAAARGENHNLTVGLVPTMGALHDGHLSLIKRAKSECDTVVVSVFVNPIQFNNQEDLAKYPRTVEADCEKLASVGADFVLTPSVEEMYPEPVTTTYHFGALEQVMEGPRRPGHFSGVAVVVRRLFDIVHPQKAYFGEKDFQQIAIVRNLLEQIKYPIELVPCPIVRADDGLALSSRNMRLSASARKVAPTIYATLRQAVEMSATHSVAEVKQWVMDTLTAYHSPDGTLINPDTYHVFDPEYFEIVDDTTLQPVQDWQTVQGVVGCIAVWLTGVRLIDMVRFR